MKNYNQLTFLGNKTRTNTLEKFKSLFISYFNNVKGGMMERDLIENEESIKARTEINYILKKVHKIIQASGISTTIYYSPPPAIGGLAGDVDIIYNLFNLRRYDMQPRSIMDFIDRSLGVYRDDKVSSIIRTINPFFWLNKLFGCISRIPFFMLGSVGFQQNKLEESFLGKIIKGLLYLIEVVASFLIILQVLGYLDKFKTMLNI